jgi:hypothetical protein
MRRAFVKRSHSQIFSIKIKIPLAGFFSVANDSTPLTKKGNKNK